jgi:hypothetical protein
MMIHGQNGENTIIIITKIVDVGLAIVDLMHNNPLYHA